MRITILLFTFLATLALLLWVTTSGFIFGLGAVVLLVFTLISIGYTDSALLFFLGAREVKSMEEGRFHAASIQEAYKLAVAEPRLYSYNGSLDRAFVVQCRKGIGLVVAKDLLEVCTQEELSAISFELLLQVKKNLASKRTKAMFLVGAILWISHLFVEILFKIVPIKEVKIYLNWFFHYLLKPWLDFIFQITIGKSYFSKLERYLKDYPVENDLLHKVGAKIKKSEELQSFSTKKLIEFSSLNKSRHFQRIISLEFLPHEWDTIFSAAPENRV